MVRSIRWRLVTSYVLLSLLAVGVTGVVATSLVDHYVSQREVSNLTANAEAVARRAAPLMRPAVRRDALGELARTASFLGDVRVRILDANSGVIADSGTSTMGEDLAWILPPDDRTAAESNRRTPVYLVPLRGRLASRPAIEVVRSAGSVLQLRPGTEITVVRREAGAWGRSFHFDQVAVIRDDSVEALRATTSHPVDSRGSDQHGADGDTHSERTVLHPIGTGDSLMGYVEISQGPDLRSEAVAATRRAFGLAAVGATLVAAVVGLFVSHGLTAPIRNLSAATTRMTAGDLSARAAIWSEDEIGRLTRQFNQMAEQLQSSFAQLTAERDVLRRFIADASHELRTPLTALRTFNELLESTPPDDEATRTEFLSESRTQIERLQWLTHQLLDLSRLDAGLVALDVATHDVGDLIETATAPFRPVAREKGIRLESAVPDPPIGIPCDSGWLGVALSNLIDNALKFTPCGGEVRIGADSEGGTIRLWVRDTGPGIASVDLPRIFERFYRASGSATPGAGLGLAIVQSIVHAHGGRATVENLPDAGCRFVVALPVNRTGNDGHDRADPRLAHVAE